MSYGSKLVSRSTRWRAQLLCSTPKISRIETGTRSPTLRDVRDLCVLYRVGDAEQERLMTIAREAKQQGWWNKFDDLGIELVDRPRNRG